MELLSLETPRAPFSFIPERAVFHLRLDWADFRWRSVLAGNIDENTRVARPPGLP